MREKLFLDINISSHLSVLCVSVCVRVCFDSQRRPNEEPDTSSRVGFDVGDELIEVAKFS